MISISLLATSFIFAFLFEIVQELATQSRNKEIGKAAEIAAPTDRFVHIIVFLIHTFVFYAIAYFINTLL